jgi:hypothetical protein
MVLQSALSVARLEAALADSHEFGTSVASRSVLSVNHLTNISAPIYWNVL